MADDSNPFAAPEAVVADPAPPVRRRPRRRCASPRRRGRAAQPASLAPLPRGVAPPGGAGLPPGCAPGPGPPRPPRARRGRPPALLVSGGAGRGGFQEPGMHG